MPNDKKQNQNSDSESTDMEESRQSDISSKGGMSQGQEESSENADDTGTDRETGQN